MTGAGVVRGSADVGLAVRCKLVFGDFTGTAAKIQFLGWTHKPFGDWWRHPIFSPHGLWTFLSGLLATFWQGELFWHRQPLVLPVVMEQGKKNTYLL